MPRRRRVPGTFDRRGNTYRVRLRVAGQRYIYTVPTTDRRVAEQFAIAKGHELARVAARRATGLVTGVRFSALLEHFERDQLPAVSEGTQGAYRDSLKPIRQYFIDTLSDPSLESIQARHIVEYLAWRRVHRLGADRASKKQALTKDGKAEAEKRAARPVRNRTLQKDRAVLHRLFTIADRLEYREGNPVARTDMPKADTRDPVILTLDQYDALINAYAGRPMLALYVLLLGETGMRCESEALQLTWADVRLDDGFVWVPQRDGHRTKGGKGRWTPMTPRLTTAMRAHFARYRFAQYGGASVPWIFHHDHTSRTYEAGGRIGSLRGSFRRAAARAKLPPEFRAHDLRHRRVTTWLAEGKSATLVREAVGHADLRTTMLYTHLAKEHLRALVDHAPSIAAPATAQVEAAVRS